MTDSMDNLKLLRPGVQAQAGVDKWGTGGPPDLFFEVSCVG